MGRAVSRQGPRRQGPRQLLALGYAGSERTTRRAVAIVKKDYRAGRRRVHRPWVTEPGMWPQYDFGDGPVIEGIKTTLFCAWLAWSRFRVVLAIRDKTMPSVFAALDVTRPSLARHRPYRKSLVTQNDAACGIASQPSLRMESSGRGRAMAHVPVCARRHLQLVEGGRRARRGLVYQDHVTLLDCLELGTLYAKVSYMDADDIVILRWGEGPSWTEP